MTRSDPSGGGDGTVVEEGYYGKEVVECVMTWRVKVVQILGDYFLGKAQTEGGSYHGSLAQNPCRANARRKGLVNERE